ncbi:MAG: hypothetical protein FWE95_08635, partial [Planctomycetaceae bacterium]|nr:hypothetical protein [Planctomycetaceae bacterium]
MIFNHKRILLHTLFLIGALGTADPLFAQLQPHSPSQLQAQQLPQIPMSQMPQSQNAQQQPQVPQQPPLEAGGITVPLTRRSPDEIVQALRQVCGHRFIAQAQYQLLFSSNRDNVARQCALRIDPQTRRVILSGDRNLSEQVAHVISAIDLPPPPNKGRQIVPYQHTPPDVLVRAVESYRVQRPTAPRQPNGVQQVQYQDGGFGFIDQGMFMSGFGQAGNASQIDVVDDWGYRLIQGLDVIILEAEGPRLTQFIDMIRQLEAISKINRPRVEVIYLKYQNNVSIGGLLSQVGADGLSLSAAILQMVQGQVRIFPMTSPNGMLLIGWGNAMDVAKEFIEALDVQPSVEDSRLHFFKLTHISAANARAIVQGTFPAPTGLSALMARLQIFHDQRTNILIVQGAPAEIAEVELLLKEIDVPDAAPTLHLQPFQVKNQLAVDLAQTLTQALMSGTTDGKFPTLEIKIQSEEGQRVVRSTILSDLLVTWDVRTNMVFVRAPEDCMEFIEELIKILDAPNQEASIKIFRIENGDAESLIAMLTSLIPSNAQGLPGPQLPGTDQGDALIAMSFAADRRTNSIIAAGSPGDLVVIEALINYLDQEDALTREESVYFLKSMKAEDVALTINEYIRSRRAIQQAALGVISPYIQLETEVIVIADVASNSLVISATPKYYDDIMKLIKEIDKMPPQVVIQVLIAEVTLSDNKEWAAELGLQDPLFLGRGGNMNFNNFNPLPSGQGTQPGTVASQMLTNFPGAVGRAGGGMVFSASSDYLNIMLRALHTNNRLEVLSNPTITTMNNQQALLSVGQEVPRIMGNTSTQGVITPNIVDRPV